MKSKGKNATTSNGVQSEVCTLPDLLTLNESDVLTAMISIFQLKNIKLKAISVLADAWQCTGQHVHDVMNGKSIPSFDQWMKAQRVLETDLYTHWIITKLGKERI